MLALPSQLKSIGFHHSKRSFSGFTGSDYELPLLPVRSMLAERLYHTSGYVDGRSEIASLEYQRGRLELHNQILKREWNAMESENLAQSVQSHVLLSINDRAQ